MPIVPTGTSSNPTTNNRGPTTTSLAIIIISSIAGATLLLVTILCCALRRRRKINNETQKEKDLQNQESFSDSQPMTMDPRFNFDFEIESEPPSPVHESGPAVISRPPPVAYIQESLARGTIPVKPQQRRESLASWSAFSFSVDGSSNAKLENLTSNNYANNTNLNSNSNRPVIINTMNGTLRLPPPPLRSPSPSSIAVITAAAAALASEPSQKLKRKTFLFQKGNDSIMSPGLVPPPLPPAAPPRMPKNFLSLYSSTASNSGSSRTDGNRTDSSINVQSREWNLDSVDTPGPGDIAIVLHEYETTLRDELALVPGDFVQVHAVYLDGWGHGNVGDQFGAFPLVCVKRLVLEGVDVESENDQTDKQLQRSGISEEEDNRRRRQKKISMANVGGGGIFNEKEVNLRRSSLKLFL
ncbi:hypothetical protein HDU78_009785 [Chytriomyces hyalinus]|nr:hypothetical protein HDU78_009785 [Chytriomyces hyalinus]